MPANAMAKHLQGQLIQKRYHLQFHHFPVLQLYLLYRQHIPDTFRFLFYTMPLGKHRYNRFSYIENILPKLFY